MRRGRSRFSSRRKRARDGASNIAVGPSRERDEDVSIDRRRVSMT